MPIRKILLKTLSGTPVAAVTIRPGFHPSILFPSSFLPTACEYDGRDLPLSENLSLPAESRDFSLLGLMGDEILFATTLPAAEAILARERLFLRSKAQKYPEMHTEEAREIPTSPEELDEERESAPKESAITSADAQENRLKRAIEKIEKGEPFGLFRETMPTFRWAKIKEEEGEYLLGIDVDAEPPHLLFGIEGSQDYPPDEDRLWTFFPTEGELGYYLTEEVQ